jgi:hypothetical protein
MLRSPQRLHPWLALVLLMGCAGGVPGSSVETEPVPAEDTGASTTGIGETGPGISESTTEDDGTAGDETGDDATAGTATDPFDPSSSTGSDVDSTGQVESTGEDGSTGDPGAVVDLSGWVLRQTDSFREITLPEGTVLASDETLLVIRDGTREAFSEFWNTTLDPSVMVVFGDGDFPTINGDETYTLLDAEGNVLDGPTPALGLGMVLVRQSPIDDDVWATELADADTVSPGAGHPSTGDGTPYISEVSDAPGQGTFANEYVEIRLR